MIEYLRQFNNTLHTGDLDEFAKENNVPVVTRDTLTLILALLKIKKVKNILEIGTAIGYSAINMALNNPSCTIDTIERNVEMISLAKANIKKYNVDKRINVIADDALNVDLGDKVYDFIFIDAAKAQYEKFFLKFSKNLSNEGIIVSDNLFFHGLIGEKELSKNVKNLVKKIDLYNTFLKEQNDFESYFIEIGDGVAVSLRKNI